MSVSDKGRQSRRHYQRVMNADSILSPHGEYFEASCFANYGYWQPETTSAREACENLVEKLLSFLPQRSGRILDVACGLGATTRHLLRSYPAEAITAIDITEENLETARRNAPGATVLCMDATHLEFPDESFDAVLSVEAALHFQTREQFFREALRVLKPGGRLVLSDILHDRWTDVVSPLLPAENHLESPEEYDEVLRRAGFEESCVEDVTDPCWTRSNLNATRFLGDSFRRGRIDRATYNRLMIHRFLRLISTRYYVIATGRRGTGAAAELAAIGDEAALDLPGDGRRRTLPHALRVLEEHARLAHLERRKRYRKVAQAQRVLARVLRRTGDPEAARRSEVLSRFYRLAARSDHPARGGEGGGA